MKLFEQYIGDGIYAHVDGDLGMLILETQREENGRNWLGFESRELDSLLNYLQSLPAKVKAHRLAAK